MSVRMTPTAVMGVQSALILLGATLAHAYRAILEMERVALVSNETLQ